MKTEFVLFGKHIRMASRRRRRWLVTVFYAVFGVLLLATWFADPGGNGSSWVTIEFTILIGPILGGYLSYFFGKSGPGGLVKPFGGNEILTYKGRKSRSALSKIFYPEQADWSGIRNDERELTRRDSAYYSAYRALTTLIGLAFLLDYMSSPPTVFFHLSPALTHRFLRLFLQCGYILSFTLPSAILLWTEPDMESPE